MLGQVGVDGFATQGYHNPLAAYVPIQLNSVGGTIEVNDLVCNKINGQQINFGIYAYGGIYNGTYGNGNTYTTGKFNVNSTLNNINSTQWQVLCTGCKGILTISGDASATVTRQFNYTTNQFIWAIFISSTAQFTYMIV